MPNEQEISPNAIDGQTAVWLVLTTGQTAGVIAAFWEQTDAVAHQAALRSTGQVGIALVRDVVVRGVRRRCRLCREPIVLDDTLDRESWRHADDANDLGDHTAEM